MPKAIVEALAASSAHGIGRVATSKSPAMKVMWCLLFLFFLAMFIKSAVTLVARLTDDKLANTHEIDKVPFAFPDLYFCPNNAYSGSYPFELKQDEANTVNAEVARLSEIFDSRFSPGGDISLRAQFIQNSFPVHLTTRYLAQQKPQSVQECEAAPAMGLPPKFITIPQVVSFSHPENLNCFQVQLNEYQKTKIVSDNWQINLKLSTDPYFADFNYSGYAIDPISDPATGKKLPFQDWNHRYGTEQLQETGFTMLIVPAGAYPSLAHEAKFQLAPSNSYAVELSMEETEYSEELHNKLCSPGNRTAEFRNHLTGSRLEFAYSYAACYYAELGQQIMEQFGCLIASFPLVWQLKDSPHCLNMTETSMDGLRRMQQSKTNWQTIENSVRDKCRSLQPCSYRKYSASFSFSRWPSVGSSIVRHFAERSFATTPANKQLISMAKELSFGNHTAHMEGVFRSYVSESLIRVRVSARRRTSPLVSIAPAYTLTAFLADTGGLLGLYIGCSMLTLCELLDLLYRLVADAVRRKHRGEQREPPAGENPTSFVQEQQDTMLGGNTTEAV